MRKVQEGSIILKMRNTFLLLKDSLLELVKKSTDSTDSPEQEDSDAQTQFYREWIQCRHLVQCDIKKVQHKPRVFFKRSYAVYVVQVRSEVVQFETRKRYSQFEQFYQRCKRHAVLSASFPPRTVLQPGWSEDVTRPRISQLNNILRQVASSTNTALLLELFSFLGLYEHCQHMQLRPKESSLSVTDEFLMQELSRLNDNAANMLEGMRRIQQSLIYRKKRVPYEVARQLLVGGEEDEGLLPLVMSNENELVVGEGLKLLNWLVSPQTNKDWQVFRRALFKCHPTKLVLENEETRLKSEVGGEYFQFLSFYLSGRQEQDLQQVAQCYSESSRFSQEFKRWAKYNSLCSA